MRTVSHPSKPRLTKPTNELAADIVMEAIREAGANPRKAGRDERVLVLMRKWIDTEISREQFLESIRNLKF